jgi:hypothetical protein
MHPSDFPSPAGHFTTMTLRRLIVVVLLALVVLIPSEMARSDSDSQQFRVNIPVRLSIAAPPTDQVRGYPGIGTANVIFAPQTWQARSNSSLGANVTLETATAFRHVTATSSKRNARLDLTLVGSTGPATWTVNTATASTNYAAGNEQARVRMTSNGAGGATFRLLVTFITGAPGSLQEGDYTTTVVGTITAN